MAVRFVRCQCSNSMNEKLLHSGLRMPPMPCCLTCCAPVCHCSFHLAAPQKSLNRSWVYLMIWMHFSSVSHYKPQVNCWVLNHWNSCVSMTPCDFLGKYNSYLRRNTICLWGKSSVPVGWNTMKLNSGKNVSALERERKKTNESYSQGHLRSHICKCTVMSVCASLQWDVQ